MMRAELMMRRALIAGVAAILALTIGAGMMLATGSGLPLLVLGTALGFYSSRTGRRAEQLYKNEERGRR